jgi:hypothetical protein
MSKLFFIFFSTICVLVSGYAQELDSAAAIESHMIMRDYETALTLCKKAINSGNNSLELKKLHVEILAKMHLDFEAFACWKRYFQDQKEMDYELVETLGWSVLNACSKNSNPQLHATLLSGAFAVDDVRGVALIAKHLESSNSFIRFMALQLAPRYRDEMIIETIQNMFGYF